MNFKQMGTMTFNEIREMLRTVAADRLKKDPKLISLSEIMARDEFEAMDDFHITFVVKINEDLNKEKK